MYDFSTLSPIDFEGLAREILQAELRIRFESFGPAADKGIDFRAARGNGHVIVQAKHYWRSGHKELLRAVASENLKVSTLTPRPKRYILVTSTSMSPALKDRIVAAMPNTPLRPEDIFGKEDLNNLLTQHQEIETKTFKIWLSSVNILERILRSGIYNRTQTEMMLIRQMIARFVHNQSVAEAEAILAEAGTLIIAGEPGVGKTTLARILVWLHAAQGWNIYVVDDIRETFEVANEGDQRLTFFDDFLGQVRLSSDLVHGIDQRLPPFLERVRTNKNLRFILTTRDYILNQGQILSARLSTRNFDRSRYTLNVDAYTRRTRAEILYNHLYFSDLPEKDRDALIADDFYLRIIDHKNFNPRLIETIANADYAVVADEPIRTSVERILNYPHALWERPYRNHISDEGKALMLAILFNGSLVPLGQLEQTFCRIVQALELSAAQATLPAKFRVSLKELEGSVAAIIDRKVRFANPSVRAYLQVVVMEDNLLPLVVKHLETYDELRQCWSIWSASGARGMLGDHVRSLWSDAIDRMRAGDSGKAIERLVFVVEIYDMCSEDIILNCVRQELDAFANSELDGEDVSASCLAPENATMNLLPIDEIDRLRLLLTIRVSEILKEYAFALNLEDIAALNNALQSYGADIEIANAALDSAIREYVGVIDQHLGTLESIEELDTFESELIQLIDQSRFYSASVERSIESHRARIHDRQIQNESQDHYRGYRSTFIETGASTDDIRSMFREIYQ